MVQDAICPFLCMSIPGSKAESVCDETLWRTFRIIIFVEYVDYFLPYG